MALAVGSTDNQTTTSSNINSKAFNNVAGNVLVVVVESFDASATNRQVNTITYNGVSLLPISGATADIAGGQRSETWYLNSPATGSNTLTITMKGSITEIDAAWITFTGADTTSSVINASNSGTAATNSINVSVNTTVANCYLIGGVQSANNVITLDATSTSIMNLAGGTSRAQYKSIAGTGANALTNTTSATPENMVMGLIAIAPPVAATTYQATFMMMGQGM